MTSRGRWIVGIVAAVAVIAAAGTAFVIFRGDSRQPEKSAEYVRLGNAALADNDIEGARAFFTKAIKFDEKNKDAHYDLGFVFQVHDAKPTQAEAEYRLAIDIDPGFAKAIYSLALVRAGAMDTDEAIALYRRVILIDPDFAEAHFNLGLLLRDNGQRAAGDAEIAKGVALKPSLGARFAPTTTSRPKKK
jgi:tetratricopeptide (TPR) repeat protein